MTSRRLVLICLSGLMTACAVGSSDGTDTPDGTSVAVADSATEATTPDGFVTDVVASEGPLLDAAAADGPSPDAGSPLDGGGADGGGADGGGADGGGADGGSADVPVDGGELSCPPGRNACGGLCVDPAIDARNCGGCGIACMAGVACVGGHCACPETQTECHGVCVDTGTDVAHCGGCDQPCAPPSAVPACQGGVCSVASCATGHADCDGLAANGCEVALAGAGACGSGTDLGAFCGDVSCGFLCPGTSPRSVQTRTGRGGVWYHARANECSDCIASIEARVTLASPPGANYDLYVWAPCGTLLGSSTRGAGMVDEVTGTHADRPLADDSFDYYIEVRYVSGAVCGSWTLTVDARGPSATSC